jgi:hypothetical protein
LRTDDEFSVSDRLVKRCRQVAYGQINLIRANIELFREEGLDLLKDSFLASVRPERKDAQ